MFNASNVQFITQTRTEHLTAQDKKQMKKNKTFNPLENMLGMAERHSEKSPQAGVSIIYSLGFSSFLVLESYDATLRCMRGRSLVKIVFIPPFSLE